MSRVDRIRARLVLEAHVAFTIALVVRERLAARLVRWLVPAGIMLLTACGPDTFTVAPLSATDAGRDGEQASDASSSSDAATIDGPVTDAPDGCAMQPGSMACDAVMNAYCARKVQCFGGTVGDCRTACVPQAQGFDCSMAIYTSRTICEDKAAACVSYIQSASCTNINSCGTVGQKCVDFWATF